MKDSALFTTSTKRAGGVWEVSRNTACPRHVRRLSVFIVHREGRWMKDSTGTVTAHAHYRQFHKSLTQILDLFPMTLIFTDNNIFINLKFYHPDLLYIAFIFYISVFTNRAIYFVMRFKGRTTRTIDSSNGNRFLSFSHLDWL